MKLKIEYKVKFRVWKYTIGTVKGVGDVLSFPLPVPNPIDVVLFNDRGVYLRLFTE